MPIELYPSVAKIKRNGVYENLPGFVPETGSVATQQMIATAESSNIAQYVHEKGEYFRLNDTLYQAIVKINIGDAIVVGTNCEVAVLGNDVTHIANSIADYELGIATATHTTGEYFMVGETLYVATDDIDIGDSISTSTNCRLAVVGDELSVLNTTINQEIIETTEIESNNLLDINNVTSGYYWQGTHRTSSSYNNTGFIEVEEGETLTYQYGSELASSPTRAIAELRFVDAYNADKQSVSSASKTSVRSYTVPEGIKYVILGINAGYMRPDGTSNSAVVYSTTVVDYEPYFEPYKETVLRNTVLPPFIRQPVYIYKTDTQAQVIEKLVNAFKAGNRDIIFETSVYTLTTALESVAQTYSLEVNEIPIGNNCRYFFNGSTIIGTVDLTQHTGETEFYCNLFGTQKQATSFEMYDGILIATDTRYVVHDEANAQSETYKHLYDNMEMQYITSERTEDIRKCIGGGTGKNGVIEIVGCKFTSDGTDVCVSYHGNAADIEGAKFDLNVRNSWFSNSIRAGALSTNQTGRLFYTGNSTASNIQTYANWTVTEFLNEVRT